MKFDNHSKNWYYCRSFIHFSNYSKGLVDKGAKKERYCIFKKIGVVLVFVFSLFQVFNFLVCFNLDKKGFGIGIIHRSTEYILYYISPHFSWLMWQISYKVSWWCIIFVNLGLSQKFFFFYVCFLNKVYASRVFAKKLHHRYITGS